MTASTKQDVTWSSVRMARTTSGGKITGRARVGEIVLARHGAEYSAHQVNHTALTARQERHVQLQLVVTETQLYPHLLDHYLQAVHRMVAVYLTALMVLGPTHKLLNASSLNQVSKEMHRPRPQARLNVEGPSTLMELHHPATHVLLATSATSREVQCRALSCSGRIKALVIVRSVQMAKTAEF